MGFLHQPRAFQPNSSLGLCISHRCSKLWLDYCITAWYLPMKSKCCKFSELNRMAKAANFELFCEGIQADEFKMRIFFSHNKI
jgi:hypothetical protein